MYEPPRNKKKQFPGYNWATCSWRIYGNLFLFLFPYIPQEQGAQL
jgi:hypothetical protein